MTATEEQEKAVERTPAMIVQFQVSPERVLYVLDEQGQLWYRAIYNSAGGWRLLWPPAQVAP